MITLEKDIEKQLRKEVEDFGGKCLKWVCPGWAGVPDRIVLLPGGCIYFVETKKPKGGVLSALQRKWRSWLTELGFSYQLIWNEEGLRRFKNKALIPVNSRGCDNCRWSEARIEEGPCLICEHCDLWESKED